ncbi:MAG TPA: LysE family transporter [Saprospiraceae bacterium]|nr:LysE family transporter [Saprospiraceae bacterium]
MAAKAADTYNDAYFCLLFFTTMLLQGIVLGLSLSFMVGPLLFAILQAGIERGFRAGLAVAAGIWTSDVLYVLIVLFGLEALAAMTALPGFRLWAGLAGGALLVAFGAGNLLSSGQATWSRLTNTQRTDILATQGRDDLPQRSDDLESSDRVYTSRRYSAYFLRGFLLNTINPFTVFFWLGITGAVLIPNGWNDAQILIFFGGMLGALVLTDTLKAYAAKRIRSFLTPRHTQQMRQGIGVLLIVFGVVLVARVL